ncbi:MAG: TIGR04282 family arsenosugar biosynthesis glycosyltransferase [Polyangiaceae bacterium]|nr:TIGR04282 family arsenosugar biosynthesis glycosyltransferase [Myxococcales bacterium]MCB9586575.1 TIGR04282 family arsenosugar biosynthesis glycosyltransferase [Polyangiaceae bacterium]MCB9606082.1 TIGR04282 family arsenosugar biosynthesis glycosyltransferase [Polyangiaceae bacterium]
MYFPHGHIIVFAKEPLPGRVKTRLCPPLDATEAAELAHAGLLDTLQLASRAAPTTLVWDGRVEAVPPLDPSPDVLPQSTGDLGMRMSAGFSARFASGAAWVVALGTDSPGLPESALLEACAALQGASTPEAVFGPTSDGGYYLLGLSTWQSELLGALPWSQPTTYQATRSRLASWGYACRDVATYFDVDVAADLRRLELAWRSGKLEAPATAAWLERWFSAHAAKPRA